MEKECLAFSLADKVIGPPAGGLSHQQFFCCPLIVEPFAPFLRETVKTSSLSRDIQEDTVRKVGRTGV